MIVEESCVDLKLAELEYGVARDAQRELPCTLHSHRVLGGQIRVKVRVKVRVQVQVQVKILFQA